MSTKDAQLDAAVLRRVRSLSRTELRRIAVDDLYNLLEGYTDEELADFIQENGPRICRFYIHNDPLFDGLTYGYTWNGWDVVCVTYGTLMDMIAVYEVEGDHETAEKLREIEPDDDGTYSLHGFCVTIEDSEDAA